MSMVQNASTAYISREDHQWVKFPPSSFEVEGSTSSELLDAYELDTRSVETCSSFREKPNDNPLKEGFTRWPKSGAFPRLNAWASARGLSDDDRVNVTLGLMAQWKLKRDDPQAWEAKEKLRGTSRFKMIMEEDLPFLPGNGIPEFWRKVPGHDRKCGGCRICIKAFLLASKSRKEKRDAVQSSKKRSGRVEDRRSGDGDAERQFKHEPGCKDTSQCYCFLTAPLSKLSKATLMKNRLDAARPSRRPEKNGQQTQPNDPGDKTPKDGLLEDPEYALSDDRLFQDWPLMHSPHVRPFEDSEKFRWFGKACDPELLPWCERELAPFWLWPFHSQDEDAETLVKRGDAFADDPRTAFAMLVHNRRIDPAHKSRLRSVDGGRSTLTMHGLFRAILDRQLDFSEDEKRTLLREDAQRRWERERRSAPAMRRLRRKRPKEVFQSVSSNNIDARTAQTGHLKGSRAKDSSWAVHWDIRETLTSLMNPVLPAANQSEIGENTPREYRHSSPVSSSLPLPEEKHQPKPKYDASSPELAHSSDVGIDAGDVDTGAGSGGRSGPIQFGETSLHMQSIESIPPLPTFEHAPPGSEYDDDEGGNNDEGAADDDDVKLLHRADLAAEQNNLQIARARRKIFSLQMERDCLILLARLSEARQVAETLTSHPVPLPESLTRLPALGDIDTAIENEDNDDKDIQSDQDHNKPMVMTPVVFDGRSFDPFYLTGTYHMRLANFTDPATIGRVVPNLIAMHRRAAYNADLFAPLDAHLVKLYFMRNISAVEQEARTWRQESSEKAMADREVDPRVMVLRRGLYSLEQAREYVKIRERESKSSVELARKMWDVFMRGVDVGAEVERLQRKIREKRERRMRKKSDRKPAKADEEEDEEKKMASLDMVISKDAASGKKLYKSALTEDGRMTAEQWKRLTGFDWKGSYEESGYDVARGRLENRHGMDELD